MDQPYTIGQRIRQLRTSKGISLATLAATSGLSKGYLSRVERGVHSLDQRRSLLAVADALEVAPTRLTGQPYDPVTRQEDTVRVAVADIRDVLYGSRLGEQYADAPARDLAGLAASANRVADLHGACALAGVGPRLPDLLTDLYAHVADPRAEVSQQALRSLVDVLHTTADLAHWAGEPELAHRAADQAVAAARLVPDDPALLGLANFSLVHALGWVEGRHARLRADALAARAADELQPHAAGGEPAEIYGMLRLITAWSRLLVGATADADAQFAEAVRTAARTGDGRAHRLWFGPTNVAAWRVGLAVERGDGGQVPELAQAVDVAALPAPERRAGHWINVGRGLAQEPATARRAIEAFRRAQRLTPMRTRLNPHVRGVTQRLMYDVGGADVRQFAVWLGVIPR